MAKYNFAIPGPRGLAAVNEEDTVTPPDIDDKIRDMFLYVMFARIAANDNENHEFETKFDPDSQDIELQIPEKFMQIIESTTKGAYFVRYIKWLIEDSLLWSLEEVDQADNTDPCEQSSIITFYKSLFNKAAAFDELIINSSTSGTSEINWCKGNKQKITLTEDTSFTFANPPGPTGLQLIVEQDDTGGHDVSFPANVLFPRGNQPNSTTGANRVDVWSFLYDENNYYATNARDFR